MCDEKEEGREKGASMDSSHGGRQQIGNNGYWEMTPTHIQMNLLHTKYKDENGRPNTYYHSKEDKGKFRSSTPFHPIYHLILFNIYHPKYVW